jgi:hypothetical protein
LLRNAISSLVLRLPGTSRHLSIAYPGCEVSPALEVERAVCLTGGIAHLIRPGEQRAVCGMSPVLRLSKMEDWQAVWREQALAWDLCDGCVAGEMRQP